MWHQVCRSGEKEALALFRRVQKHYPLANDQDYKRNGHWQAELLRIDLQLLEAHRREVGLADLDEDGADAEPETAPVETVETAPETPEPETEPETEEEMVELEEELEPGESLRAKQNLKVRNSVVPTAPTPRTSVYKPLKTSPFLRPEPYNGHAEKRPAVRAAPASTASALASVPASKTAPAVPVKAAAELERIQEFIDLWELEPVETKKCLARLTPQRRAWLYENYDGSGDLLAFLRAAPTATAASAAAARVAAPEQFGGLIRNLLSS
ncbi:Polyadenylate-binding protein 1 [Durusdinium trenchii]|uniref:Polyadenylate-binding protein 1 n=1 Tax=Durusdinium trenchii TaxID=1381693 RepID=A0ABP0HTV2_9DINO